MKFNKIKILLFVLLLGLMTSVYSQYSINVQKVDLIEFILQVGEITGRTFVYDEGRVRGEVTVVSESDLSEEGVFALLQSVLRVRGFHVVDDGEISRILPIQDARLWSYDIDSDEVTPDSFVSKVIRLEHVTAQEASRVLRQMVSTYGHLAPVLEPNALIISDHAGNVDRILGLIEELDAPHEKISVILTLQHALVSDIAAMLQEIHPEIIRTQGGGSQTGTGLTAFANENNNTLFLWGDPSEIALTSDTVRKLDQPYSVTGKTRVYNLQHAEAEDTASILNSLITGQESGQHGGQNTSTGATDVVITADTANNAVLARGNPSVLTEIQNIIDQIDIPRMQVLIEAAIVEVNTEINRTVGIEVGATDGSGEEIPLFTSSITGILTGLLSTLRDSGLDVTESEAGLNALSRTNSPSLAIAKLDPDGVSFGAILAALSTNTNANLLSTPHVIALDNIQSRIFVGQTVPFRTGVSNIQDPGGQGQISQVERSDVGILLEVTPKIRPDLSVHLSVLSEISAVTAAALGIGETGFSDVVTDKREVQTTVVAKNGQTIVLGGLIRDDSNLTIRRIPGLGHIPYLGRLFRSEHKVASKRHLLIFLRPVVVESDEVMSSTLERKMERIWKLKLEKQMVPDEDLPPLDEFYDGLP
ncbi:MAG: type II secretion system protein GspD [Gammaproteobacteria bacterium]|nr:type II secretion system secretin GspD [Gammaproteobacteria bacterium]MXX95778.1 type II secretion system protein GspD [Gammaproteobacteria bacterium]MYF53436.1 type II secretion system protein GspD [Gammaproteobacteria bacterium]MYK43744.1 type II secretion system protein GspD [Gammaproteobacteria bacterium]